MSAVSNGTIYWAVRLASVLGRSPADILDMDTSEFGAAVKMLMAVDQQITNERALGLPRR